MQQNIFQELQNFKDKCDNARQRGDSAALLLLKKQGVKLPSVWRFSSTSFYEFLSGGGGYNVIWRLASPNKETALNAWQWVERKKKRYNGQNPPVSSRNEF